MNKNRTVLISVLMVAVLLSVLSTVPAGNETSDAVAWNGEAAEKYEIGGGEGLSADDPVRISDAGELKLLSNNVNNGTESGKFFILTADIDLSGNQWVPIGTEEHPFSGVFDGDRKTVSGLTIDLKNNENKDVYCGLFGEVKGEINQNYTSTDQIFDTGSNTLYEEPIAESNYTAVIKNLILSDIHISTDGSKVGALAGETWNTLIKNVKVSDGIIVGTNSVGGVLGRGYNTVLIDVSSGKDMEVGSGDNVTGNVYNFGGIVGSLRGDKEGLSATVRCTNGSKVEAFLSTGGIGGIVGQVDNHSLAVIGCVNYGNLSVKNPTGTIANAYTKVVGGIGGQFHGTSSNIIANCVNYGDIHGGSESSPVGSLAGIVNYYSGTIYNCDNSGDVSGYSYCSGGIVGHGLILDIAGCENSGNISTSFNGGYSSTIAAGTNIVTYRDMTFKNVEELSNAMVKSAKSYNFLTDTAAVISFIGVTVTDNTGNLDLPKFVGSLISDTEICGQVTVGDRTVHNASAPYQSNINVEIGIPGVDVLLPEGKTVNGQVKLSADNMTFTNAGVIEKDCISSGNGITVINLGKIIVMSASGNDFTLYNGLPDDNDASMEGLSVKGVNMVIFNYGTIDRNGTGHTLNFGTIQPVNDTTAFFYNYGKVVGGNGGSNGSWYIIYAPGFDHVRIVNYEGSTMQIGEKGNWYIAYGYDGVPTTPGDYTGKKGVFEFMYADGTVKKSDGDIHVPIKNNFIGNSNADLDLKITLITESDLEAKVGEYGYVDLEHAVRYATSGDAVILLKDVKIEDMTVGVGVTLNLNGKTLTATGTVTVWGKVIGDIAGIVKFAVFFDVSPKDSTVVLKGSNGAVIESVDGVYLVEAGMYTYTISKSGYVTVSGTLNMGNESQSVSRTLSPVSSGSDSETITNPDGSVTEKKTEVVTNPDGSRTEKKTENTTNTDGSKTEKEQSVTVGTDGSKTEKSAETTKDLNGNITGSVEKVKMEDKSTGVSTEAVKNTDSNGNTVSESRTNIPAVTDKDNGNAVTSVTADSLAKAVEHVKSVSDTGTKAVIVIDGTASTPEGVNGAKVSIPVSSVKSVLGDTSAEISVKTDIGNITLSRDVLNSMSGNDGESMDIAVKNVRSDELTDAQKAKAGNNPVFNFSAAVGDRNMHDLGGKVGITLPYELAEGQDPNSVKVFYLDDNGNVKKFDCKYDRSSKTVSFETDHFSYFVLTQDDLSENNTLMIVALVIIAIIAAAAVALFVRSRQGSKQ